MADSDRVIWRQPSGEPVACNEKLMVLTENHAELRQAIQDAFDDAILMGCSASQFRQLLHQLVEAIQPGYPEID